MRKAVEIHLTAEQEKKLRTWATGRKHARWLTERAKIILHAVAGLSNIEISRLVGTDKNTVGRWRRRFAEQGIPGIEKELPRR